VFENGLMINDPSDPTERGVVQVLELIQGNGDSMSNGNARENLNKVPSVRSSPTVGDNVVFKGYAGMTVYFSEIVPDSDPASNTTWLHLIGGNYVNYEDATHKGDGSYFRILTQPTQDPPPAGATVTDVNIKLASGSVVTTTYSDGTQKVETA